MVDKIILQDGMFLLNQLREELFTDLQANPCGGIILEAVQPMDDLHLEIIVCRRRMWKIRRWTEVAEQLKREMEEVRGHDDKADAAWFPEARMALEGMEKNVEPRVDG